MTSDTVAKFCAAGLDPVVLATNHPALAEAAAGLGARIFDARAASFHFGRSLRGGVRESGADR